MYLGHFVGQPKGKMDVGSPLPLDMRRQIDVQQHSAGARDDGIRVKKSICEQVYGAGKTGGKYYQLVDKVLTEHNRI